MNSSGTVNPQWYQTRTYAVSRGPRAPLRPPPRAPKVESRPDMFDINQITAGIFEETIRGLGGFLDELKPEEYHQYALKFANAIKNGADPYNAKLSGENDIPLKVLHEMACVLWLARHSAAAHAFSIAMWASASEAGHHVSTLSLARCLMISGGWGKSQRLKRVENRFRQVVAEGKDQNALTAEGENFLQIGQYEAAVKILKPALSLNDSDFEWRDDCKICLGKSYLKLGRSAEARQLFEAVENARISDADAELAQMLRKTNPDEARQRMYSAATGGRQDMFNQLAELELEKEAQATDDESRKNHQLWAMEWLRLAEPSVMF
ncbi:hypothetical protein FSARC_12939 [Fusarium sarcochroum]|uniref:Tetratricopeptide repeat protein n=1 Tax=Fusarium sarcochroum TaxID=1208366 RepID=A0A8H4T4U7_9HYPO|nr:hypothetical protein FSARC_12939 [Fusarium sarcochroum]